MKKNKFSDLAPGVTLDPTKDFLISLQKQSDNTFKNVLSTPSSVLYEASISITAAQLKTLNTTKVLLIAAPGAGYAIALVSVCGKLKYLAPTFTQGQFDMIIDTAPVPYCGGYFLDSTHDVMQYLPINNGTTDDIIMLENKGLYLEAGSANNSGGSTLQLYILYRLVKLIP